jgi:hypothetical protein
VRDALEDGAAGGPGRWDALAANRVAPEPCEMATLLVFEILWLKGGGSLGLKFLISGLKRRERVAARINEC